MAKNSEVMEDENLFIVIEYRRFLSTMYIPQPARSEVFDQLCFFQFQLVIDCNEPRLSVTTTTLIIFKEYARYNA